MRKALSLLAVAGLLAAPGAQAQDPGTFKPTGGWTADYGDDYCRLVRTFSDGADEISLGLERTQPGTATRMILVGKALKPYRGAENLGYTLLPSGAAQETQVSRSETADGSQYLSVELISLAAAAQPAQGAVPAPPRPYDRAAERETARGITAIAFSEGLASPVRLETGPLRAPVAAMQACADDLLKVWGLDPDKHKTLTAQPILNPNSSGVLPQGTIPFTEFGKFGGGSNQVRLLVGADGKPTSCTIYAPSLSQSLNDKICKLAMERASFQPAKDAGGQAMASFWMGSPMFLGPPFPSGR